jgi:hypothetical protein
MLPMIVSSRYIPENIKDVGLFVPNAIQILQITHCLIVLCAIVLLTKGKDIQMHNVIVVIQRGRRNKIY